MQLFYHFFYKKFVYVRKNGYLCTQIWYKSMKRVLLLTYFVVATAIFAVAQTYGTQYKSGYESTNIDRMSNNGNYDNLAPVGALEAPSMATTTYDQIEINTTGPRRDFINPSNPGDQSGESPIGEPLVMLLFASLFAGAMAYRKRLAMK